MINNILLEFVEIYQIRPDLFQVLHVDILVILRSDFNYL